MKVRVLVYSYKGKYMSKFFKSIINEVNIDENHYPDAFRILKNAPKKLYYIGDISSLNSENCVSIVGSRRSTLYGKHLTRSLVQALANFRTTIVSGAAIGIDQEAHFAALENNLNTVLVLGSGILESHLDLNSFFMKRVMENPNNLIISEFEPNFKAQKWTFAHRNRLIAALSKATILVQAAAKSGSLITTQYANKIGKPVYTFATELDKPSFAANKFLLDCSAAKSIKSIDEFTNSLNLELNSSSKKKPVAKNFAVGLAAEIIKLLKSGSQSFDSIKSKLQKHEVGISQTLSLLEVKGLIKREPGSEFSLAQLVR